MLNEHNAIQNAYLQKVDNAAIDNMKQLQETDPITARYCVHNNSAPVNKLKVMIKKMKIVS